MRLAFMGTPDFAVAALDALHAAGHEIVCVYTQPPRPANRGKSLTPTPVHQRAEQLGLEVRHPLKLRGQQAELDAFRALDLDVAVVAAYGLILPQDVLDAPKYGCLNIHASLLPRWRGAAPIHRAIEAGDAETGITIMQMDAGLDTGAMLLKRSTPVKADETTPQLHDRLAAMGAEMIVEALANLPTLTPEPQPAEGVTYASKIDKAEARLDFTQPAARLERKVRALNPFPGAYAEYEGERIKILKAEVAPGKPGAEPGAVIDDRLTIQTADGALRPLLLQRAGKQALELDVFIRGFSIPSGARFG
ncbi:MAG TPA: methionyl-tRNA formyltransferase [Pedomonas sp.]|uniref:methionyl-tRNA formyltransferase n=1 Tax=Pedomonas sp. TaxID=2976421 RepID=UPI002F3F6955